MTGFDLERFAAACVAAEGRDHVVELVRDAVARRDEVLRAIGPVEEMYSRFLHASEARSGQIIGWAPGMMAPPHEHRMWAVIGTLGGQEDNGLHRRAAGGVERIGGVAIPEGEVVALDDDVIHDVRNPRDAFTVAIHVYGGDSQHAPRGIWTPVPGAEERFSAEGPEWIMNEYNRRQRLEPVPFAKENIPRIMGAIFAEMGRA